jgi:hypothetical protein
MNSRRFIASPEPMASQRLKLAHSKGTADVAEWVKNGSRGLAPERLLCPPIADEVDGSRSRHLGAKV